MVVLHSSNSKMVSTQGRAFRLLFSATSQSFHHHSIAWLHSYRQCVFSLVWNHLVPQFSSLAFKLALPWEFHLWLLALHIAAIVLMASPSNFSTARIEDSLNPFFLHNSDHLGSMLVNQPLTSDNYSTWPKSMLMALWTKNKIGFVNGFIKPTSSTDPLFMA